MNAIKQIAVSGVVFSFALGAAALAMVEPPQTVLKQDLPIITEQELQYMSLADPYPEYYSAYISIVPDDEDCSEAELESLAELEPIADKHSSNIRLK